MTENFDFIIEVVRKVDYIALAALVVSLVSAVFSIWNARRQHSASQSSLKISALQLQEAYFQNIRDWANECSDCFSDAVNLCRMDPATTENDSFFNRRMNLIASFSSLLDRGRWYFPNETHQLDPEHKSIKEKAYQGFRQPILNDIATAFHLCCMLNYIDCEKNAGLKTPLVECKRSFTNHAQTFLNPLEQQAKFAEAMQITPPRKAD